jgi:outer membrane immunogenic protein
MNSKFIALLGGALSIGLVTSASAADMAVKARPMAPPPVAIYNWTGFYIGGHVGGSWTRETWVNTLNTTGFGDLIPGEGFSQRGTGVFGGGHAGYNWQFTNIVLGIEGTISAMDNRGTVANTVFGAADDVFSWRASWMATVTGRLGVAFTNHLLYVKGGYAGVDNRLSVVDVVPAIVGSGAASQWHHGWTVGAGWEYGITPNWIIGLEYNYAAFETKNYQLAGAAVGSYAFDARPRDIQSAVVRLSYKFGGPVVARY